MDGPLLNKFISEKKMIRDDKKSVLRAVKTDWRELQFASKILKNDRKIVLQAVKTDWRELQYPFEIQ